MRLLYSKLGYENPTNLIKSCNLVPENWVLFKRRNQKSRGVIVYINNFTTFILSLAFTLTVALFDCSSSWKQLQCPFSRSCLAVWVALLRISLLWCYLCSPSFWLAVLPQSMVILQILLRLIPKFIFTMNSAPPLSCYRFVLSLIFVCLVDCCFFRSNNTTELSIIKLLLFQLPSSCNIWQ